MGSSDRQHFVVPSAGPVPTGYGFQLVGPGVDVDVAPQKAAIEVRDEGPDRLQGGRPAIRPDVGPPIAEPN